MCDFCCSLTNAEHVLMLAVQQLLGYSVNVTIVNGVREFGPSDEVIYSVILLVFVSIEHHI